MMNQAQKSAPLVARLTRQSSFTSRPWTSGSPGVVSPSSRVVATDSENVSTTGTPNSRPSSATQYLIQSPPLSSDRFSARRLSALGQDIARSLSRGSLFSPMSARSEETDDAPLALPLNDEVPGTPPKLTDAAASVRDDVRTPENPTQSTSGGHSPLRKPIAQKSPPRPEKSSVPESVAKSPVYATSSDTIGVQLVRSLRSDSKISPSELVMHVMNLIDASCYTMRRSDARYDSFVELLTILNLLLIIETGLGTYSPSIGGIPRCVDPSHVDWKSLPENRQLNSAQLETIKIVDGWLNEYNSFYVPLGAAEEKQIDQYAALFFERLPWIRRSVYQPGTVASHKQESSTSPFFGASRVQSTEGMVGNPTFRQTVTVPGLAPVVPHDMQSHSVLDRLTKCEREELLPGQYSALDVNKLWVLGRGFERPSKLGSRETSEWLSSLKHLIATVTSSYLASIGKSRNEITVAEHDEIRTLRVGMIAEFIMKTPLLRGETN